MLYDKILFKILIKILKIRFFKYEVVVAGCRIQIHAGYLLIYK